MMSRVSGVSARISRGSNNDTTRKLFPFNIPSYKPLGRSAGALALLPGWWVVRSVLDSENAEWLAARARWVSRTGKTKVRFFHSKLISR